MNSYRPKSKKMTDETCGVPANILCVVKPTRLAVFPQRYYVAACAVKLHDNKLPRRELLTCVSDAVHVGKTKEKTNRKKREGTHA